MEIRDIYGSRVVRDGFINCIVDNYGNRVYEIRGDRIYDTYGNWKYEIRGSRIYDRNGNWLYEIREDRVFDTYGNRFGYDNNK